METGHPAFLIRKMADSNVDTLDVADLWCASLAYPTEARLEMLRQHYLTQINSMIAEEGEGRFKDTDFSLLLKNDEEHHILEITYRYEPGYVFTARMRLPDEVISGNIYMTLTVSPGNKFNKETVVNVRVHELDDYIKAWLQRLDDELSSAPLQRQLEEQRQEIDSILVQLDDIPKDYFSKQEAETLRSKLDALEMRLANNLAQAITNQQELESKVQAIADDVSVLKENINVLNKRGWAKSLVTRTFEWAKDPTNRKMLKSGVEVAKDLLLEAGEQTPK